MSETPDELRALASQLRNTGWRINDEAADAIDALLARLATAEAENERHRKANLVRAVINGADPEWIADLVSAESFDAIPWQIADRILSEAVARREQP